MSTELNDLERAVLTALVEGDHPVLEALRHQLETCGVKSRELTGHGFFTELEVEPSCRPAPTSCKRLSIGDLNARIGGLENGAGFVLFVDRGQLTMLEGYSYDESWPEIISDFALEYTGGARDIAALNLDGSHPR